MLRLIFCLFLLLLVGCSLPIVPRDLGIIPLQKQDVIFHPASAKPADVDSQSLSSARVRISGENYHVELRGVSLQNVLQVIMQEVLKYPYVLDVDEQILSQNYDISVPRKIKKRELYNICISMLERSGLSVIDDGGVLYVTSSDKRSEINSEKFVVYQAQNIKADDILVAIMPLVGGDLKEGRVSVSSDKKRSVIIKGHEGRVLKILKAIREIDIAEKQIVTNLQICELTLRDRLQYGLEYYLKGVLGDFSASLSSPLLGDLGYILKIGTNNRINAEFNLMQQDGLLKIISRPVIVTVDGKQSIMRIGTEIPILETEKITDNDSVFQAVKYRNTGLLLTLNPCVLSEGEIQINIQVEISQGSSNTVSNLDSPIIINRSLSTTLNMLSGDRVLLAGIMQNTIDKTNTSMPILNLLGSNFYESNKTELAIIMQTYIVDVEDLDQLSDSEFSKIRGL